MTPGEQRFANHRGIEPLLWAFVALATIEVLVVHLVVSSHWHRAAWPLTTVTGLSLLLIVRWVRSFRRLPHRLSERELVLNLGLLRSVTVPLSSIAAVRDQWDGEVLRDKATLSLSPIAYPNRMIELDPPLAGKRCALRRIAFRVDDPGAFDAAIREVSGSARR